jgi:hypothetical protein
MLFIAMHESGCGTSVLTSAFRGQQRTRYAQIEVFAS